MSIISTVSAVPSRLLCIYASVYGIAEGESREYLEAVFTPPSLGKRGSNEEGDSGSSLFTSALQETRRLKIIEEKDGRIYGVPQASSEKRRKDAECELAFRSAISSIVFHPDSAREAEQSAFMLALAWFLTKSPLEPMNFSEPPQETLRKDLGDYREQTELTSQPRYQNFLYWCRYLGFAIFVGFESGRVVIPDPTRAIQSVLPTIFGEAQTLEIESFLTSLSRIFPVFEGGAINAQLSSMKTKAIEDDNTLSVALSLSLQRLADRGEIVLDSVADARGRILQFGVSTGRVTRIRRGGLNDA